MTDTYGMIDEKTLEANSLAISDAILSTVYQSNVSMAHNLWTDIFCFDDSSDPSHFIFEINVGKSRSLSDPTPSDIDVKNKKAWV